MLGRSPSLVGRCIIVSIGDNDYNSILTGCLVPFMIMGRVTYVHHYVRTFNIFPYTGSSHRQQLPTLYFAVLMAAHLLDHFVFSSRRLQQKTKTIVFGVVAFMIVANFWWFRGLAFGIDGPISDHWGLLWRDVSIKPV